MFVGPGGGDLPLFKRWKRVTNCTLTICTKRFKLAPRSERLRTVFFFVAFFASAFCRRQPRVNPLLTHLLFDTIVRVPHSGALSNLDNLH